MYTQISKQCSFEIFQIHYWYSTTIFIVQPYPVTPKAIVASRPFPTSLVAAITYGLRSKSLSRESHRACDRRSLQGFSRRTCSNLYATFGIDQALKVERLNCTLNLGVWRTCLSLQTKKHSPFFLDLNVYSWWRLRLTRTRIQFRRLMSFAVARSCSGI